MSMVNTLVSVGNKIADSVYGKGNFDILSNKDYIWTQSDNIDISSVPRVEIKGYQNLTNEFLQNLYYNKEMETIKANSFGAVQTFWSLYKNLYKLGSNMINMTLPYTGKYPISTTVHYKAISTEPSTIVSDLEKFKYNLGKFADAVQTNFSMLTNYAYNLGEVNNAAEASDVLNKFSGKAYMSQTVKAYDGAETTQFETTFPLINVSTDHAEKNLKFIRTIQRSLAPYAININAVVLPLIWSFNIPGLIKIPLGYIGQFDATPVGTSKMINGKIHPNAWRVHCTFNSITPLTKQMIDTIDEDDPKNGDYSKLFKQQGAQAAAETSLEEKPASTPSSPTSRSVYGAYQTIGGNQIPFLGR